MPPYPRQDCTVIRILSELLKDRHPSFGWMQRIVVAVQRLFAFATPDRAYRSCAGYPGVSGTADSLKRDGIGCETQAR